MGQGMEMKGHSLAVLTACCAVEGIWGMKESEEDSKVKPKQALRLLDRPERACGVSVEGLGRKARHFCIGHFDC